MTTINDIKENITNAVSKYIKLDATDKTFLFAKPSGVQSDALLAYILKEEKLEVFKPKYIYFKDNENGAMGKMLNKDQALHLNSKE